MTSNTEDLSTLTLRVHLEPEQNAQDVQWLYARMTEFNARGGGPTDLVPVTLFLRDQHGKPHGGLLGWTLWSWLHIDTLWVSDSLRGRGHGRTLLTAAERAARIRGCTLAEVDTFNFQARGFYEKCGYEVFGTLQGIGRGRLERYYLKKDLAKG